MSSETTAFKLPAQESLESIGAWPYRSVKNFNSFQLFLPSLPGSCVTSRKPGWWTFSCCLLIGRSRSSPPRSRPTPSRPEEESSYVKKLAECTLSWLLFGRRRLTEAMTSSCSRSLSDDDAVGARWLSDSCLDCGGCHVHLYPPCPFKVSCSLFLVSCTPSWKISTSSR